MPARHALVAAALVVPLALGGLPAHAQDPLATAEPAEPEAPAAPTSNDVVELRSGGLLRGTILEVLPDDSLTIESSTTGERKTFPWAQISAYERGGTRTDVAPRTDARPKSKEPAELEPGPGVPRFHIDPSRPANLQLFQVTSEMVATGSAGTMVGMTYRPVCTSPCGKPIDGTSGSPFFIAGDGVPASGRFTLSGYDGDLTAQVKVGRRGLRITGFIFAAGVGPAVLAGGAAWLAVAALSPPSRTYLDPMTGDFTTVEGKPKLGAPIALVVVGGALLVGGIVMAVLGRTRVKLVPRGLGLLRPLQFG